jgi:hypothetical protein
VACASGVLRAKSLELLQDGVGGGGTVERILAPVLVLYELLDLDDQLIKQVIQQSIRSTWSLP